MRRSPLPPATHPSANRSGETRCAGQVHRATRLRPRLQRTGHAARPRRPPAGRRRDACVGRRIVGPEDSRRPRSCGLRLSRGAREGRVAAVRCRARVKATWTDRQELPRHDQLEPYLRNGAVDQGWLGRQSRRRRCGDGRRGEDALRHVFLAEPEPRVARPSCAFADVRDEGTAPSGVLAGQPRHARNALARARPQAERCESYSSRVRVVRHERGRLRGGRRGAAFEDRAGSRCACSGRCRTSMDGIRRDRSSSSISARGP